jgi:DNA-binding transcriptional ArsR family regulator
VLAAWLAVSCIVAQVHFVYDHIMDVTFISIENRADDAVCGIAAAIGEPARARMLYSLMDGHARTSTELAVVAEVSPSTASAHLNRLKAESLVRVMVQGKHRYYSLGGPKVARVLEGLNVLASGASAKAGPLSKFVPNTPNRLRMARTCYDHMAGTAGVLLHDRLLAMQWLAAGPNSDQAEYQLTAEGTKGFRSLGIDVDATAMLRRRFAYACLDWSERRPHMGGGLAAALLNLVLKRKWLIRDLDSRALAVTNAGRRELLTRFGVSV